MKLNAIIFHTTRLEAVREFYSETLGLKVSSFAKDGKQVLDQSDTYVNYDLDGLLLCFETHQVRSDIGTVVLKVDNFSVVKDSLEKSGVELGGNPYYLKVKDPDGRAVIIEPA